MGTTERTATSTFGTTNRRGHDAAAFYRRFPEPQLRTSERVTVAPDRACGMWVGDATNIAVLPDHSCALVVTSPPYYAGKDYETDPERDGSAATWEAHLDLLAATFAEAMRILEDGGRIAVNVANLGRRPYRDLTGTVAALLTGAGFLLRGEIVWIKGRGANGSAAWGSYLKASNPVLRDVTERVVVASAGRFDRAIHWRKRREVGLPWRSTITPAAFRRDTLDTWEIAAESAKRVGHPAPFPVELPRRLIELYRHCV